MITPVVRRLDLRLGLGSRENRRNDMTPSTVTRKFLVSPLRLYFRRTTLVHPFCPTALSALGPDPPYPTLIHPLLFTLPPTIRHFSIVMDLWLNPYPYSLLPPPPLLLLVTPTLFCALGHTPLYHLLVFIPNKIVGMSWLCNVIVVVHEVIWIIHEFVIHEFVNIQIYQKNRRKTILLTIYSWQKD